MPQPTVFPDGRTAFVQSINLTDFAERDCHIKLWKEDVVFVLNQIEKLNQSDKDNRFTGRMDTSRIGMFGHSYGGATAAQVLVEDSVSKRPSIWMVHYMGKMFRNLELENRF